MPLPKVYFLSSNHIEPWDFSNPDKVGIGGSETSHIELCWRLARRGYEVTSYAPLPKRETLGWRETTWKHYLDCDYSQPGIWIIYRNPEEIDNFTEDHPGQKLVFMAQDTYYKSATVERYAKLDRFLCLCPDHKQYVEAEWPSLERKIFLTGNGLKADLVEQVLAEGIERNPKKIIYVSSPDRGLKNAAIIVDRVREYHPDVELHTYYGFDNLKTMGKGATEATAYLSEMIVKDISDIVDSRKWIVQHGRLPQPELYREMASAGIVLYATSFTETGAIAPSMECPALGAIPITNPIWALRHNITNGIIIQGNPDHDLLVRARYAGEVLRLTSDVGLQIQEQIRPGMMAEARARHDWERRVDDLEVLFSELGVREMEAEVA